MRYTLRRTGIVLGALLMLSACASSGSQPSQDERMKKAVEEALAKIDTAKIGRDAVAQALAKNKNDPAKAGKDAVATIDYDFAPSPHDKSVRWQVFASALKYNDITGLRLVAPNKLLISIEGSNPRLLDTDKGTRLWELKSLMYDEEAYAAAKKGGMFPPVKYRTYACIMVHRDAVLFRADGEKSTKVLAVETATGNRRWAAELERAGELSFVPHPESDIIIAVQQEKRRAALTAFSVSTGAVAWKRETRYGSGTSEPPGPAKRDAVLWTFYDGVESLSAADGKTAWRREDILAGNQSPPMQLSGGKLFVLDGKNALHVLDARSGKTVASGKQREGAVYTNIFPIDEWVYLRGIEKQPSGEPRFFVSAVRDSDAKELWADLDKDPSVSNLIDEGGVLYFSTPYTVVALDREKGSRRFAARASDIGKSFPVQIRKYRDRVVYIGELVIAAFDAKTGAKVYRHGFDPINQTAHMDALNEIIESKQKFLSWFTGPLSGWDLGSANMSTFFFDQARQSQNQSNYLKQEASHLAKTANTIGDPVAASRSEIKYMNANIDSAFANAQASMGMAFMTVENIQRGVAAATAADRQTLQKMLRIRKLLYAAYVVTQQGEYAYRPTKEAGTVGISLIHLPSGRASYTELTPEYELIGVFSLVDLNKGLVYQPLAKQNGYSVDFAARPVAIPK